MSEDTRPYNDKNQPHGYWEYHWSNGNKVMFKIYFVNGIRIGYGEHYYGDCNDIKKNHST